jgi:nicotinate-nucleotide adenylyltransferase
MRIGIYGGAFNPFHRSHLAVMQYALAKSKLGELRVIPAWEHAFGKDMAPFEDRYQMACRGAQYAFDSRVMVSDVERKLQTKYTVDLVDHLVKTEPNKKWVLIVGPDAPATFPTWHRWEDLAKMVEILVVPEQGTVRSTLVREAAAKGDEGGLRGMIHVPVLTYIKAKGLYGWKDNSIPV